MEIEYKKQSQNFTDTPVKTASAAILIATYNEAGNIDPLIRKTFSIGEKAGLDLSIVVIDDDSPDGTGKILDSMKEESKGKLHVIHRKNERGCGSARRVGFKYIQNLPVDYVIEMDGDGSHDPKYIPLFMIMGRQFDVIIGSRYVEGGITAGWPMSRRIISGIANTIYRLLLGTKIHDLSGGFKCYRKKVVVELPWDEFLSTSYSIGIETLFRCFKRGYTFLEVPVFFFNRKLGKSKFSWKEGTTALQILLRLVMKFGRPIRIYDFKDDVKDEN